MIKARLKVSLFLLLLLLGGSQRQQPANAQGQTKLVLAFYYAWFDPSSFGAGKTPFQPYEPYFSTSAATIEQHVAQAKSAGIDGFIQSWYGPDPSQQTEPNFQLLLNTASRYGFTAAVDFEAASPFFNNQQDRINALNTLINTHAQHPAYLRVDGKPVIFFWANWLYTMDEWAAIRQAVDPNHQTIWMADGVQTNYMAVFDGHHLYNTAWADHPGSTAATWKSRVQTASVTYGSYKYWAATAMPGFNDSLLGRGESTIIRPRQNGDYYRNSFRGAAASQPDMLLITSFNEWPEGSHIEPSVEFGSFYLDLTAELSAAYKSGSIPPAVIPQQPWSTPTPFATPTYGPSPTPSDTPTPTSTATPIYTPTPEENGYITYIVQAGDSLASIAQRYKVRLIDLYTFNRFDNKTVLYPGQKITLALSDALRFTPFFPGHPRATILEDGTILHQIGSGETLISIAIEYGLTLAQIRELNGLNDNSFIVEGQSLIVGKQPRPEAVGGSSSQDAPSPTPSSTPTIAPTQTTAPTITPFSPPVVTVETAATAFHETAVPETAVPAPSEPNHLGNYFLGAALLLGLSGAFYWLLNRS